MSVCSMQAVGSVGDKTIDFYKIRNKHINQGNIDAREGFVRHFQNKYPIIK